MSNVIAMDRERFLKEIRKKRKLLEISQDAIAKKLGMTSQNYSKLERGVIGIALDKVEEICKILDIDFSKINDTEKKLPQSNILESRVAFLESYIRQQSRPSSDDETIKIYEVLSVTDKEVAEFVIKNIRDLATLDKLYIKAIAIKDGDSIAKWAKLVVEMGLKIGKVTDEFYILKPSERASYVEKNGLKSEPKSNHTTKAKVSKSDD